MHEAFRVASSGKRGPVHIDLPKDIMTAVLQGAAVPLPMQPPPQARGYMHIHGMHIACAFYTAGARLYAHARHAHRMGSTTGGGPQGARPRGEPAARRQEAHPLCRPGCQRRCGRADRARRTVQHPCHHHASRHGYAIALLTARNPPYLSKPL
eukprot:scaffold20776_cov28-Phaeocystis_antarctica.AAC.1